jgi:hypothetical protein
VSHGYIAGSGAETYVHQEQSGAEERDLAGVAGGVMGPSDAL